MALLARVADRLYWGARYIERAEDTARILRSYSDLLVDLPTDLGLRWEPLVAILGSEQQFSLVEAGVDDSGQMDGERAVMQFLVADRSNPSSVVSSVALSRENLRTTREVVPREGWETLNSLYQFVVAEPERAVARRTRSRFLAAVVDESRQLDGVLESTMTRANPYRMWRLGRLIERADMTTRVLGVRAASLLRSQAAGVADDHDEVQWMGVLRSLSALQMYQRATHLPIDGASVIRFLLFYERFPRSVAGCLGELRAELSRLPRPDGPLEALGVVLAVLARIEATGDDGLALDASMDALQAALASLDDAIAARYFSSAGVG
jgi:uncharacterized alpha-E superfamily protein